MRRITLTVELTPAQAAGLKRFSDKVSHDQALAVLYPHVSRAVRDDQAYNILGAFSVLEKQLGELGVSDYPWIEVGE